jgi:ADP-ribosylglycohydrolase
MVSDDTEHIIFVAQSLLRWSAHPKRFVQRLAWCLRGWIILLPAGVGFATLRSVLKLWLGFSPDRSGVYSAGNGPAMRSAPIGAFFFDRPKRIEEFVRLSTRLTHTDPLAELGARLVADFAAWSINNITGGRPEPEEFVSRFRAIDPDHEVWQEAVQAIERAIVEDIEVSDFAGKLSPPSGVSGYVMHTVPVAVYAWYRHWGDFRRTLASVIECGGDTDTSGAIAGALAGATVGISDIPTEWVSGIVEYPRNVSLLLKLGDTLAHASRSEEEQPAVRYFWPALMLRNIVFLILVLMHGFRRLLPPY